ncbi:MAG: DUF4388 domain-containing protein [Planctomycetota bacterium]|nr:DUF4388 domain-containing protein [Planctomycetota bacterium]
MSSGEPVGYLLGAKSRPLPLHPGDELTMGREPANNLFFEDAHASRLHAMILVNSAGAVFVKDLGSTNGTWLNHERLRAEEPRPLRSGDSVRVGGRVVSFIGNSPNVVPALEEMEATDQLARMRTLQEGYVWKNGGVMPDHEQPPPPDSGPRLPHVPELVATEEGLPSMPEPSLAGKLSDQSLPQVLQFLHATARTGELEVRGQKLKGLIGFSQGQAAFAHATALSGDTFNFSDHVDRKGDEAVLTMAGFRDGTFHFKQLDELNRPRNIDLPTITLIFECCRQMDEARREKAT